MITFTNISIDHLQGRVKSNNDEGQDSFPSTLKKNKKKASMDLHQEIHAVHADFLAYT